MVSDAGLKRFRNYCGPIEGREEWFSLGENHERRRAFGENRLRNRYRAVSVFVQFVARKAPRAMRCHTNVWMRQSFLACFRYRVWYRLSTVFFLRSLAVSVNPSA
jgi:hypothetical protein